MQRVGSAIAVTCLGSFLYIPPATAANLVTNGTFDTNTNGWAGAAWDGTRDANGSATSGSDQVSVIWQTGTTSQNSIQCVPLISAGTSYNASVAILVPSDPNLNSAPGLAQLQLSWSSDPACQNLNTTETGSFIVGPINSTYPRDKWVVFDSGPQTAPATTRSMYLAPACRDTGAAPAGFLNRRGRFASSYLAQVHGSLSGCRPLRLGALAGLCGCPLRGLRRGSARG
jgi:hypothetical protein